MFVILTIALDDMLGPTKRPDAITNFSGPDFAEPATYYPPQEKR